MAYLEVRNVTKKYDSKGGTVEALRDISLSAEPGEWIALTGRSGCGKSTLLNICGAMDFPTSGSVSLGGRSTAGLNDRDLTKLRRTSIGFIFQSFQLLQTLSVIENVEVPMLLTGAKAPRERARERLAWVQLDHLADRLPHQLSGGQQQRVAIARALANDPQVILADEPTGNLDSVTGETVLSLLGKITKEARALVLMATHSRESAASADRTLMMTDGRWAVEA